MYYIQIMLIYAMLTEILQDEMGLGRSLEGLDLIADAIGVVFGHLIFDRMKKCFGVLKIILFC